MLTCNIISRAAHLQLYNFNFLLVIYVFQDGIKDKAVESILPGRSCESSQVQSPFGALGACSNTNFTDFIQKSIPRCIYIQMLKCAARGKLE